MVGALRVGSPRCEIVGILTSWARSVATGHSAAAVRQSGSCLEPWWNRVFGRGGVIIGGVKQTRVTDKARINPTTVGGVSQTGGAPHALYAMLGPLRCRLVSTGKAVSSARSRMRRRRSAQTSRLGRPRSMPSRRLL